MADTSQFFVPKANDWGVDALTRLFGQDSLLSSVLSLYNSIFMAVGGTLLLTLMIRVVVETAQHGQLAGKHSEVWFPIRFFLAVGLLVPLPPIGMTAGQYVIVGVARMGLAAGTVVWEQAATKMASLDAVVQPTPPEVKKMARTIWQIEICRALQNVVAKSGGTTISDPLTPSRLGVWERREANGQGGGGIDRQCGEVRYKMDSRSPILSAHATAVDALERSLRPYAEKMAPMLLPPYNSAPPEPISADLGSIMKAYTDAIMTAATAEVAQKNGELLAAQKDAAISGGWVKAGAWIMNLTWANEAVWNAVGSLPEAVGPHYDWWSADIYEEVRAAFISADQWWDQRVVRATANEQALNGLTATDGGTSEIAKFFDLSRLQSFYDWFLLSEHSNNPIAELVGLGHALVITFWTALITYGAASAAASAAQNWASSSLEGFITNSVVGGTASAAAAGAWGLLSALGPTITLIALSIGGAGALLAYILPLTPALHWFFGVVRYFIQIAIAVLGAPVWAIAHLELEGEGIGGKAARGYEVLYDLLCRPIIMVVSLVLAFALIGVFGELFALTYKESIGNALGGHFGGITGLLTFTVVGAITCMSMVWITMNMVGEAANRIMEMAGIRGGGMGGDTGHDIKDIQGQFGHAANTGREALMMGTGARERIRAGHREKKPGAQMGRDIGEDFISPDGHGGGGKPL